jgi:hypothetical protein
LERSEVVDDELVSPEADEMSATHLLQRAIYVYGRQSQCFAEITLREWQMTDVALSETDRVQPREQLAEQVRRSLQRCPVADIQYPGHARRLFDLRGQPQRAQELREFLQQRLEVNAAETQRLELIDRADGMIRALHDAGAQIANVSRNQERDDVSLAIRESDVAARKARENQMRVGWRSIVGDEVTAGACSFKGGGKCAHSALRLIADEGEAFQQTNERLHDLEVTCDVPRE